MAEIQVQIIFDYIDPGSYLVHEVLRRWMEDRGRRFSASWIPLELRPPSSPTMDPQSPSWAAMTEAMAAEAEANGIPFRMPERVPRSRKAHELSLHAREKGFFNEAHQAIFEAHFVRGEDIGRVDVLTRIAERIRLDRGETHTILGVDRFLEGVEEARGLAKEMGVRGVPTLEFPTLRIEGFEGVDALRSALDRIAAVEG